MRMMLEVHHIESMGTLDGPGVRTVVFLQGCPLRCGYCHNPDSWLPGQGKEYTYDDLYDIIRRYRYYYGKTGGVTFSGGEPLMQAKVLKSFVRRLQEEGIHVALDTSGAIYNPESQELMAMVDLVILDIKATDPQKHLILTGQTNTRVMENLNLIQGLGKPHWIRQVSLHAFNGDPASQRSIHAMGQDPACEKVEFLDYHELGLDKWEDWQMQYQMRF